MTLALALGCAGCAAIDPYQRAGMWQPMGAVQGNLAAMVADPADLAMGHGDGHAAQFQTTAAVDRLWADQTKPLLDAPQGSGQPAVTPQSPAPSSGSGGN